MSFFPTILYPLIVKLEKYDVNKDDLNYLSYCIDLFSSPCKKRNHLLVNKVTVFVTHGVIELQLYNSGRSGPDILWGNESNEEI
jgi:hypothetical protein